MLRESLGVPVAYGQHSDVQEALLAAVVLGAGALFIYVAEERSENLPDGPHAVLCSDVAALIASIGRAVATLGSEQRVDDSNTEMLRRRIRRSAVARRPLASGHVVTRADIVFQRPGTGVEPYQVERVLGGTLAHAVAAGDDLPLND